MTTDSINALVWKEDLELPHPTGTDKQADKERLLKTLDRHPVYIPLSVVRELPALLRGANYSISVAVGWDGLCYRVISLNPAGLYGVAIDLGSTNIAGRLLDLQSGRLLQSVQVSNPQLAFGSDILTRMFYAESARDNALHVVLAGAVSGLIRDLIEARDVSSRDVVAVTIAGNTVMTHFLLDLPTDNIPVSPYVPAIHAPGFIRCDEFGDSLVLGVNREALVYVFPGTGSYVGGDLVAGVLASGLYLSHGPQALIDVGTNAEVAVGCKDWILVGAGAAGPAFDEGVARAGRRAAPGAIYHADIEPSTARVAVKTFDNLPPNGICGSGMVSLVAGLYKAGLIDNRGAFIPGEAITPEVGGQYAFVVHDDGTNRIVLTQDDIDTFMLTKAAMFTLFYVLIGSVGITFDDIGRLYLTGALGTGIDHDAAITLGLIPDFPMDRVEAITNSSVLGAEALLLNRALLRDIDTITGLITYKEMNEDGEFMREFLSARFIPHTEPHRLKVHR
ncbi:metal-binding protein [Candidatus Magnetobacterium bavaricum]|uniref:Metal-binding protein n=1 Tax=Candidatus Magnetobacterium bavaricum TaxID=29290 RepID=A0A0F3GT33_9BACT|nr:metal-binding protein [Candidatus Magnetobacterium bavaricum]